jgi:cytochrome c
MNFFDRIVIPPSANHILLLKYIMTISLMLFIPYLGMIIGASSLSVYFKRKSIKTGNTLYASFAKDIIEKLTFSKYAVVALGIIPLLSILFCYAQFLYNSGTVAVTYILFSVDIFILAFILIYVFRNSFLQGSIISSLEEALKSEPNIESRPEMKEVHEMGDRLKNTANHSGIWGTVLLFIGAYIFLASTSLASDPDRWADVRNFFEVLLSWNAVFSFLYLISAAGAITGSAILFFFFKWPVYRNESTGGSQNMSSEYSSYVKNFSVILTFVSVLLLPVLLFMSFMFVPQIALSKQVFLYLILLLVAVLVSCNLLYLMFKNSDVSFATGLFFLIFIIFGFNILKDQLVLGNALKEQAGILIAKSEEHEKELQSQLVSSSGIDAEQIYNTRCIACHRFDVKLVGPPYQQTVPKYNGDINALSEYIYNPVKKDPAFPPMPNQGLKKKEAVAMAQWLISKVGSKK